MKLSITMERHTMTVSQMRRRLAQLLACLDGRQEVSFDFHAVLNNAKITEAVTEERGAPGKTSLVLN